MWLHSLIAIDNFEAAQRRREEARNSLEGYLYRLRYLLEEADESANSGDGDAQASTPFGKCSKPEERKQIGEKVEETLTWLNLDGDDAQLVDFWDKKDEIE